MLNFLYTGDYDIPTEDTVTPLKLHAEMYSLADKYCIDSLMTMAAEKYRKAIQRKPSVDDYILSIPAVYTPPATRGGLRQIVVESVKTILNKSVEKDGVWPHLGLIMSEAPEFGCDILEKYVIAPITGYCQGCGSNQHAEVLQAKCKRCSRGGISNVH